MLVPTQYSGRVDDPLDPITEGSAEGDLVFGMIRRNEHLFCPDLDTAPPPGWRISAPQTYKSFAAVPVAAGQQRVRHADGGCVRQRRDQADRRALLRLLAACWRTR